MPGSIRALAAGVAGTGLTAALLGGVTLLARSAAFSAILFIALMALAAGGEALQSARRSAGAVERGGGSLAALTGALLLALSILPLIAPGPPRPVGLLALGAALVAAGAALRCAAIAALGPRFNSSNAIAPGAVLERRGLYRLFAHPSEVGLLALAAGGLTLIGAPILWLLLAPLYAVTVARLALEERALIARHGDVYRRYRAATFDPLPTLTGVRPR